MSVGVAVLQIWPSGQVGVGVGWHGTGWHPGVGVSVEVGVAVSQFMPGWHVGVGVAVHGRPVVSAHVGVAVAVHGASGSSHVGVGVAVGGQTAGGQGVNVGVEMSGVGVKVGVQVAPTSGIKFNLRLFVIDAVLKEYWSKLIPVPFCTPTVAPMPLPPALMLCP